MKWGRASSAGIPAPLGSDAPASDIPHAGTPAKNTAPKLTPAGLHGLPKGAPKRTGVNKFNATPVTVDGIRFDSTKEARRWGELRLLERAGEIRALRRQVVLPLIGMVGPMLTRTGRPMKLTVDFAYEDKRLGWAEVFEDAKGVATRDYEVRRAAAAAMGIQVREV